MGLRKQQIRTGGWHSVSRGLTGSRSAVVSASVAR